MKEGPKLHGYELIYAQAISKITRQGSQHLYKGIKK